MGYDKMRKEFICFWLNHMGTGWTTMKGSLSEDKKLMKMSGYQDDPCSGVLDQAVCTAALLCLFSNALPLHVQR